MKDRSIHYPGRHMITGWFNDNGRVVEVQGFYCQNGPTLDGHYNVQYGDVVGPGPDNPYPYYWVPEAGVSTSAESLHATREDAISEARKQLVSERVDIEARLAEL